MGIDAAAGCVGNRTRRVDLGELALFNELISVSPGFEVFSANDLMRDARDEDPCTGSRGSGVVVWDDGGLLSCDRLVIFCSIQCCWVISNGKKSLDGLLYEEILFRILQDSVFRVIISAVGTALKLT